MKQFFSILLSVLCFFASAQKVNLGPYTTTAKNQFIHANSNVASGNSVEAIAEFLSKTSGCRKCTFLAADIAESPAGMHYTFQVYINNLPLENSIAKVHTNKNNEIYLYSFNIPENSKLESIKTRTFQPDFSDISETVRVVTKHPTIVFTPQQKATQGEKLIFINEPNSIYLQRIYISANEYFEDDLRSFASDTTIHGKVFMPDPLTTSGEFYGGNYQDGLKEDTASVIVRAFANTRQNPFSTNDIPITFRGQNFTVLAQNFTNNFTGDSIYVYLREIFLSTTGQVTGYNAALTNDRTINTTTLIIEDFDFEELNNERVWVSTKGTFSGGRFRLSNDYFEIIDFSLPAIPPVSMLNDTFSFIRSNPGFEDFNAFYHLNAYRDYVEELGFTSLYRRKISVDTHGNNGADNSFFSHTPIYDTISRTPLVLDTLSLNRLIFGNGGVDDAEDADVVIHEYGHALSLLAAPLTNTGNERRALDEGFGDYLAASYSRNFSEHQWQNVFTWDGHNEFWSGRLADLDRNFLDIDTSRNIYYNGEIWASMLMDLWAQLGRETTDKLAIQTMFFNMPNGTFAQARDNLLLSDSILFNFENKCTIYNVLFNRKFTGQFCVDGQLVNNTGLTVLNSNAFLDASGTTTIIIGEQNFTSFNAYMADITGRKIWELNNQTSRSFEVNSAGLPNGVYIIRVRTNNKRYETKLLKATN